MDPANPGRGPTTDAEQVLVTAAVGEDIPQDWDATRIGVTLRDDDTGRLSEAFPL